MSQSAGTQSRETVITEKTKVTISVVVMLATALAFWFFTMGSLRTSFTDRITESDRRFDARLDELQMRFDSRLHSIERSIAGMSATMQGVGTSLQQIRLDMQKRTTTDQVRALLLQELQPVWRSIESLKAEISKPPDRGK